MDEISEVPEIDEFLAGPLVTWFASRLKMVTDEKVNYDNLVNGYLIHNVFLQMNLQVNDTNVYPSTMDSAAWRSRNLIAILNNIRHFYEDDLGQVILRVPDVENLGREPEHHVREIEMLLGLLLGCAVQCPKKQGFIEEIKKFDETTQLALAECIAEVMGVPGIVISADMFIDIPNGQKAIERVRKIRNERDEYKAQLCLHLKQEEEQLSDDLCKKSQLKLMSSFAEQLREKSDELEDTQAELRECEKKLRDLTMINEELVLEVKNVKFYRDELDEANVKAEKAEKLEQDIARYQKKLAELDLCKARLKELEKTNKNLAERKAVLERQISSQKAEKEKTRDLRKQVTKLTEQVSNLTAENTENRDKYWQVCEEKKELQGLVKKSYKQSQANHHHEGIPSVKDDLLLNQANSQVAKLEADNQSLTSFIETLKQSLFHKSGQLSTLTRENKKLTHIIDTLNMEVKSANENYNREVIRSERLQYICNEAKKLQQQGLDNCKSLLENVQKRSASSDKSVPKNSTDVKKTDYAPKAFREQKYNVVKSRNVLKYVKSES